MACEPNGAERLNCYALVTYIPNPLGSFLDDLRRELVPNCVPHAHVTVLPPRPIAADPMEAAQAAKAYCMEFAPFEIELGAVEIFPVTNVIYLGIKRGERQLKAMHELMNAGPLYFREPFHYHPHVTVAQEVTYDRSLELAVIARQRWASFTGSRRFNVDALTFVQNTATNVWIDLAQCQLSAVPSVR